MTLILTMVTPAGIIHVSDSNLSDEKDRHAGVGKKVFRSARLRTGIACSGSYDVGRIRMNEWLPARISEYEAGGQPSVAAFSDWLNRSLEHSLTPDQKREGCWLHVAGYTRDAAGWHPEMYVLSNVPAIDGRGHYLPATETFRPLEEEYWSRWGTTPEGRARLAAGRVPIWFNGFRAGRVAYKGLADGLEGFLAAVWGHRDHDWLFRPPRTRREYASYLSIYLSVIKHLFEMSDYPGLLIGGRIQRVLVPPPRGARMANLD